MNPADMALVRDEIPGGFNLAVGEPVFLQEILNKRYPYRHEGSVKYPALGGDLYLKTLLTKSFLSEGHQVVITVGAKQALLAAIYALKRKYNKTKLFVQAPYWPSFPTMAEMSGIKFETRPNRKQWYPNPDPHWCEVLVLNNNPDGDSTFVEDAEYDIVDCAYASPIYGWDGRMPKHKISVWSAAKLLGVSGYRIGWLATEDEELAKYAAEYVEKTTSGVANTSQDLLTRLIDDLEYYDLRVRVEKRARSYLNEISKDFMELEYLFTEIEGHPTTGRGMFAWVTPKDPDRFFKALELAKVKVVSGVHCGGRVDQCRISMGVSAETMKKAVKAIKVAYGPTK